jgi:hypothetical protein
MIGCVVAAQGLAGAQGARPAAVPDITGSWERYGGFFGAPTEAQRNDPTIPPRAPQPPLKPEYLTEWQARVQAAREADAKGTPLATNYTNCLPDGMPTMMGAMFPLEILQSRGQITIIEEAFTQVRRILLDQPQKRIDDVEPGFYGRSVGHWDGDTLVVDTVGLNLQNRLGPGIGHGEKLHVVERIHRADADWLEIETTLTDPEVLAEPYTSTTSYRHLDDDIREYICLENNRDSADEQGRPGIKLE